MEEEKEEREGRGGSRCMEENMLRFKFHELLSCVCVWVFLIVAEEIVVVAVVFDVRGGVVGEAMEW